MDDLYGADAHLEAAYEDANGAALPEHLMHEQEEDVYAGTSSSDDPDDEDTGVEPETYHDEDGDVECDWEADYWEWSGWG